MLTPDSLSVWLKEQSWPIGIVLSLVVVGFIILKVSAHRRQTKLSRERSHVTEELFVDHLAQYNFDPLITGTTYRYLQEVQGVQFPVLPSDDLDEDLGLDHEDIEQTIRELLVSLHREHAPGIRYEPIHTVEGLVRHLQASPRIGQQAAA
jgi:hypothetical protein